MTIPIWNHPSISAAARAHGVSVGVLHARILRAKEKGLKLHELDAVHIISRGHRAASVPCFGYPSITRAAEAMGLPINVIASRHRLGWTKAQASWARRRTPAQWAIVEREVRALLDARRVA